MPRTSTIQTSFPLADDGLPQDYLPARQFFDQCGRRYYTSQSAFRWDLRHRHENGLVASGAVIERFAAGTRSHPRLLVSESRLIRHWREESQARAAGRR